ncbi:MAG: hypothetical protein RLY93_06930 [Sumerlaeia bacterium]
MKPATLPLLLLLALLLPGFARAQDPAPVRDEGEVVERWEIRAGELAGGGETDLALPTGFSALPGDRLIVRGFPARIPATPVLRARWDNWGPRPNAKDYPGEVASLLPPDGQVLSEVVTTGTLRLRVGQFSSWLGAPTVLRLEGESLPPIDPERRLQVTLARAPQWPVAGQRRLVALRNEHLRRFVFPESAFALAGPELQDAMRRVAPRDDDDKPLLAHAVDAHLADLYHTPLGPRPLPKDERVGYNPETPFPQVAGWRAASEGERILISAPELTGARRIGLRFAHTPRGALAGIRNADGQLLATANLFAVVPMVPGLVVEVTLPEPNPDGQLVLEALAMPPGSLGLDVFVERVMVFE